jgi:hypothetical protein
VIRLIVGSYQSGLPVLIHMRDLNYSVSSTLIFASTVKPLASGDYFVAPQRGQCRFKQMTEQGINRLPQRIDDKIGRLVREGGHRALAVRSANSISLNAEPNSALTIPENGNADRFPRFQENSWFRNPGLAPAAFAPDEGWLFLRPRRP